LRRTAAFVLLLGASAFAAARALHRFVVDGQSMLPTFAPGDRVLVNPLAYILRRPRKGDAVVVRQPGAEGRLDIKRIAAGPGEEVAIGGETRRLGPDEWFLLGDNAAESTDSHTLGPVRREDIVGPVWFKY
jgi:signal peptidase I